MEFCNECNNYLITKIANADEEDDVNKILKYECTNCGYSKNVMSDNNLVCVYSNNYRNNKLKINNINTSNLEKDPTIPRIKNLKCPQINCGSYKDMQNDILFITIDEDTMTYMYKCNVCNYKWTNK